jgi:hypothetical protein
MSASFILLAEHSTCPGVCVADIIWEGERIATIYPLEAAGVRIISHRPLNIVNRSTGGVNIIELIVA